MGWVLRSDSVFFHDDDREWVRRKWAMIRELQQKAQAENLKWQRLNDEINTYMDAKGVTDPVQRAKIKGESLALADAFAAGNWYRQSAMAHIADVDLFMRLKEWGLVGNEGR